MEKEDERVQSEKICLMKTNDTLQVKVPIKSSIHETRKMLSC